MTTDAQTIESTKNEFVRAKNGLLNIFAHTPDDRVNWSPAKTARTPVHLMVHAASAVRNLHHTMMGTPFPVPTPDEAEKYFRDEESHFSTREQALEKFTTACEDFEKWMDGLDAGQLDTEVKMPFNFGQMAIRNIMGFPAMHTQWHQAQLEYLQTIYGDMDWHMG
ncbi:MAG: DinB family protein [Armatimonadetes bacterium]|nr:DinB family protein [Armatimonadota bacterium]